MTELLNERETVKRKLLLIPSILLMVFALACVVQAWDLQDCIEVNFDHPDCDQYTTTTTQPSTTTTVEVTTTTQEGTTTTQPEVTTTTGTPPTTVPETTTTLPFDSVPTTTVIVTTTEVVTTGTTTPAVLPFTGPEDWWQELARWGAVFAISGLVFLLAYHFLPNKDRE